MSEFSRADYLRIKWPFIALAVSLMVGIGLFAGLKVLNQKSITQLQRARVSNEEARQRVEKISQEEATITANIGRYQSIVEAGTVGQKDILQMKELFNMIRSRGNLLPILLDVHAQSSFLLKYGELDGTTVENPGPPVALQVTDIDFKLPLLHENDLAILLDSLIFQRDLLPSQRELFQLQSCSVLDKSRSGQSFRQLRTQLSADCKLSWYTFRVDETKGNPERQ